MQNRDRLYELLLRLDGRGYKAYKEIQGTYQFPNFRLTIQQVQGDPFASPSKLRVEIPQAIASFPHSLYQTQSREVALRDYLTRQFERVAKGLSAHRGTGQSGLIKMVLPGQEVLARTSILLNDQRIEARFVAGLPAQGRRVLGRQATEMLCEAIPEIVSRSLSYEALNADAIQEQVEVVEDADWIRGQLCENGLIAFVANGAMLPRRSGVDPRPLKNNGIAFQSPSSLEVSFNCPNCGLIKGMGIAKGITLIVGGGYHGKSTLLEVIALGVYNHIPGDGREFVITDETAVKIRAEDGRSIADVDISPFINHLPQGRSTRQFSTENASGSTSQAANIIEAMEAGARVLLVDEDTAATNFMIRDRRMQLLIAQEKEPITPFIDKVLPLYQQHQISTILVMGGSGDYFDLAHTVIAMDNFRVKEVTETAKHIAQENPIERLSESGETFGEMTPRFPQANSIAIHQGHRPIKLKVNGAERILLGKEEIDLTAVEQLVDSCQLRAIAAAIVYARQHYFHSNRSLADILDKLISDIEVQGLDLLSQFPQGDFAYFRDYEWAASLNRLRCLEFKQKKRH